MDTFKICNKVFGKNLNIGNYFSYHCKNKINTILTKYATKVISYNASLEKKRYFYKVNLKLVLVKDVSFEATGRSKIPYKALNFALLNLSKMLRRYIRKTKFRNKSRLKVLYLKESHMEFNS